MLSGFAIAAALVALTAVVALVSSLDELARRRAGRVVLILGGVLLPLAVSGGGVAAGVSRSSQTEFCLECHEMERYGASLFADNADALSAVHYQRRLITRDRTCYACHTNYAMFGNVEAKLNGLKHVWVHYTTGAPAKIELYQPYPNGNCLHCHDDARGFVEVPEHKVELSALRADKTSCLQCHEVGHDLNPSRLWNAEPQP